MKGRFCRRIVDDLPAVPLAAFVDIVDAHNPRAAVVDRDSGRRGRSGQ